MPKRALIRRLLPGAIGNFTYIADVWLSTAKGSDHLHVRYGSLADIWSRDCKQRIFAQPTPNQISQKKIVTIDIPVDMTMTDDTVLKYTLYC
jgi:hypothetical protein